VRKYIRRIPLILFVLAILAGLMYGFKTHPLPVDLATVQRGPMILTVDQLGKTRIKQRYVITAPLAGKLHRVDVKPGADLEQLRTENKPVALLEPGRPALLDARARAEATAKESAAKARLSEGNERLDKAKKQENYARAEYDRVRRAAANGGSSRQEVEDAELKMRSGEHDLSAAKFAVQVAEFELEQAQAVLKPFTSPGEVVSIVIGSPISKGKVLKVLQESETIIAAGTAIMEVGDPESIEAEIDVLTTDAVKVRDRAKAFLEHWGGDKPLEGKVRLTEPSGFTKVSALGVEEQRVNVIIDFDVPKEWRDQVRDAYRVEARIVVWEGENVLKVPAGALFRQGKELAVYLMADGKAVLRTVKIGHNNGLDAEVLSGLRERDQVLLHPGDKIKDGVAIVSRKVE
jgi:HlyD family secretion protein